MQEMRARIHRQCRGSRVELMAENPDYAPILVNGPLAIDQLIARRIASEIR